GPQAVRLPVPKNGQRSKHLNPPSGHPLNIRPRRRHLPEERVKGARFAERSDAGEAKTPLGVRGFSRVLVDRAVVRSPLRPFGPLPPQAGDDCVAGGLRTTNYKLPNFKRL